MFKRWLRVAKREYFITLEGPILQLYGREARLQDVEIEELIIDAITAHVGQFEFMEAGRLEGGSGHGSIEVSGN